MNISKLLMNLKSFFSPTKERSVVTKSEKAWSLTVKGKITKLNKTNIDKSGKNAKFILYGTIQIEIYQLDGAGFEIKKSLDFQGKESDFIKKNSKSLTVGEIATLHFTDTSVPNGRFIFK